VVAGPPFAIASPLLRLLLTPRSQLAAGGPAALVATLWPPGAEDGFRPPPWADSDVLLVRRR
jgi:hypothetical protein